MLHKAKNWVIMILLALIAVLAIILTGRKPEWVKEKEKAVKERDKAIEKAKNQADKTKINYEEMMKKHDEEIESAGKIPSKPDIDNPDDAADYLDDILSDDGSGSGRHSIYE